MRRDKIASTKQEFSRKIDSHRVIIISEKENQQWDTTILLLEKLKSKVKRSIRL